MELLSVLSIHCNIDFSRLQVLGVISLSEKVGFFSYLSLVLLALLIHTNPNHNT